MLKAILKNIETDRACVTTSQAAAQSGLSKVYLARLLREETVEGFQLARDWFIYTDSLERFLATPRKPGPKGPTKKTKRDFISVDLESLDLGRHAKEIRWLWRLQYGSAAQESIDDILNTIHELESVEDQTKGDVFRQVYELLNSLYRLAATISRDQEKFAVALDYADNGVRVAELMGKDPYALQVQAASLYTRGVVLLAWGAFGYPKKIEAAIANFEQALPQARPQLKGMIWTEMARAKGLSHRTEDDVALSLEFLEKAEQFVREENEGDFYEHIMLDGDIKGLDERRLLVGRAKTFLALGYYERARDELDRLEAKGGGAAHTRRRAWTDILYGQASLKLGDYYTATQKAISAFNECQEIHSMVHMTRVKALHADLLQSPYRKDPEMKHLSDLIQKYTKEKKGNT